MSQCLNPNCLAVNLESHRFCQKCGKPLWLKDRYQALKLIGQGGFGKTFLAIDHDKPSKPRCVIKQFFPQIEEMGGLTKAEQLFAEEAKRLDELGHHDQIPSLLAYFTIENQQYLVQEYIEGENLEEELGRSGVFNQEKIIELLSDLLPVLDFIHAVPVIHRDIKPENIIRRAKDQKLVLVDFGAAKKIPKKGIFATGTIIGTDMYMAPEQALGKAKPASDLYSLGVTCIYLLTGRSHSELFDSESFEWSWKKYVTQNIDNDLVICLDKLIVSGTKGRYSEAQEILSYFEKHFAIKIKNNENASIVNIETKEKDRILARLKLTISKTLKIEPELVKIDSSLFIVETKSEAIDNHKSQNFKSSVIKIVSQSLFPIPYLFNQANSAIIVPQRVQKKLLGLSNGWGDSVMAVLLANAIEKEFGIKLYDGNFYYFKTIVGAVNYIYDLKVRPNK
ncbi:protein kinase domain-containing protein [Synechocystis sp. CACIAM 05]|uniref:protein kinase domain-containing protein n=1 Tax=Synechocystis sp. CACIAM 05 TaxID=1933929 RepID=UPI00138E798F|nr:protein kinase [Synechocystis sp. CACIAM 05]QHU99530.1 hypothetical protein BWK47_04905 [Synechocystis sp. CACIAM 05]